VEEPRRRLNIRKIVKRTLLAAPLALVAFPPTANSGSYRVVATADLGGADAGSLFGNLDAGTCADFCDGQSRTHVLTACEVGNTDGGQVVMCDYAIMLGGFGCGRRPHGFASTVEGCDVGTALSAMAELEAAAVHAFHHLHAELTAHGAPHALRQRALRAAADEVKHARMVGAVARRLGGHAPQPRRQKLAVRGLAEMAVENAAEGCVRETLGAVVAAWQSTHAQDQRVRQVFGVVAQEEASHAQLAWDVARWADHQLSASQRHACKEARAQAVSSTLAAAAQPVPDEMTQLLGLPNRSQQTALVEQLNATLWA
jgi:hypothetical protein